MNQWRVALFQMDIHYGDPLSNRKKVSQLFSELAKKDQRVDVVVLPELWDTGYDLTRLGEIADRDGRETKALLAGLAQSHDVNIIGGSVAKKTSSGSYNTTFVINRRGNLVHEYSKVHLFRLMEEEKFLQSGEQMDVFELENHLAASQICYDIRFPEGIRNLAAKGALVLFVAAEWPHPRLDHWRQLLIARAIENQMYVVGCNRVGDDPNHTFCGHSMIVDPSGEVLAEGMQKEEIVFGELDLEKVEIIRKQIPVFGDRRRDVYDK